MFEQRSLRVRNGHCRQNLLDTFLSCIPVVHVPHWFTVALSLCVAGKLWKVENDY